MTFLFSDTCTSELCRLCYDTYAFPGILQNEERNRALRRIVPGMLYHTPGVVSARWARLSVARAVSALGRLAPPLTGFVTIVKVLTPLREMQAISAGNGVRIPVGDAGRPESVPVIAPAK